MVQNGNKSTSALVVVGVPLVFEKNDINENVGSKSNIKYGFGSIMASVCSITLLLTIKNRRDFLSATAVPFLSFDAAADKLLAWVF